MSDKSIVCPLVVDCQSGSGTVLQSALATVYDRSSEKDVPCTLNVTDLNGNAFFTATRTSTGFSGYQFGTRVAPRSTAAPTPNAQVEDLQTQVTLLRGEVARMRMATPAPVPAPSSAVAARSETDDVEEPTLTKAERQAVQLAELNNRVESEPIDRSWSISTERTIQHVFDAGMAPGSSITSVKCASTLCRVHVAHGSDEALSCLMPSLRRHRSTSAPITIDSLTGKPFSTFGVTLPTEREGPASTEGRARSSRRRGNWRRTQA